MSNIYRDKKSLIIVLIFQQTLIGIMGLAFAVAVFRQAGLTPAETTGKLQFVLLAYAIGTLFQISRIRHIGSGLFLPPISSAIYVQPSILALTIGGLPLLVGMTIFAGFCEFIFSFIIRRTRFIIPPETCGLVILLVGLELGLSGFKVAIQPNYSNNLLICMATLFPIAALCVWTKSYIRHLSCFFGVFGGAMVASFVEPNSVKEILNSYHAIPNTFSLPPFTSLLQPIHFSGELIIPFLLVGFAASIRSLGLSIGLQQFENPKWKKPDYPQIMRVLRSDGIAAMVAGFFGTPGVNISPTASTMAIAARCTNTKIGLGMSLIFIVLSCFPKVLVFVSASPLAIVGAILIYYAAVIYTGGIRVIGAQAFGIKQVFSIGIPFCLALSSLTSQAFLQHLPPMLQTISKSPLAVGIVSAITLNLIFQIGSYRHRSFTIKFQDDKRHIVQNKFSSYGDAWGLRNDLVEDATKIASEVVEQIFHADLAMSPITVSVSNQTAYFELVFKYIGEPFKMQPIRKIDAAQILDEETFISGLKIYLRGTYPDEIKSITNGDECDITMRFNYI